MNFDILLLWAKGLMALLQAVQAVEQTCRRLPHYERCRDAALDKILGPAEPLDYVSTTAPRTPCPPYER